MTNNPLLVFAMEQESQDIFSGHDILHTGIGKVNAAYALTSRLSHSTPNIVINLGTAGSRKHASGSIINCTEFIQRDMDATPLGFQKWQTPFSSDPITITHGISVAGLQQGLCGSGDSFDTSEAAGHFDVVDMEAFALALICQRRNIPFLCLKYVSDGANDDAHLDFETALRQTAGNLLIALTHAGY